MQPTDRLRRSAADGARAMVVLTHPMASTASPDRLRRSAADGAQAMVVLTRAAAPVVSAALARGAR